MNKKTLFNKEIFQNDIELFLQSLNIDYNIKNIYNYMLVFVHRSVINEDITDFLEHNERLEFFWDAFLELSITELLYYKFPDKQEWELTDLRSSIVRWKNLALIAERLNLWKYMLLSKWEQQSKWYTNPCLLANTMEAFLWALYIDKWYKFSLNFIKEHIFSWLDSILEEWLHIDPKSKAQEYYQAEFSVTPEYRVLSESGPDHDKEYTVWLLINDKIISEWVWKSKKKAEEDSARNILEKLWLI